jgi:alanine racemase
MTRAWVDIDLGALRRNGVAIATRAGVPLVPMVKADGYGLGAVRIARVLDELDPWGFGVATVREGEELRRAGITRPIIIFTPVLTSELDAVRRSGFRPALETREAIARWSITGAPWHLAIDTGMGRSGVRWTDIAGLRDLLELAPPEGAFTHFHSAEIDDGSRVEQERRFEEALARLPFRPMLLHTDNGAAAARSERARWDLVRPGIFLYGVGSGTGAFVQPEPVATIRARVVATRWIEDGETVSYLATYRAEGRRRIATLPLGYADGYRRSFGNKTTVLVNGRRARVAGLVTMDMTMVDVTDVPCEVGDVVTVLGRDGDDAITLEELGAASGLSPYELLTGLRQRLPRRYIEVGD